MVSGLRSRGSAGPRPRFGAVCKAFSCAPRGAPDRRSRSDSPPWPSHAVPAQYEIGDAGPPLDLVETRAGSDASTRRIAESRVRLLALGEHATKDRHVVVNVVD